MKSIEESKNKTLSDIVQPKRQQEIILIARYLSINPEKVVLLVC